MFLLHVVMCSLLQLVPSKCVRRHVPLPTGEQSPLSIGLVTPGDDGWSMPVSQCKLSNTNDAEEPVVMWTWL